MRDGCEERAWAASRRIEAVLFWAGVIGMVVLGLKAAGVIP